MCCSIFLLFALHWPGLRNKHLNFLRRNYRAVGFGLERLYCFQPDVSLRLSASIFFDGSSRRRCNPNSVFFRATSVSWSLILSGGIEAVWGLCQLYGFFCFRSIFVMHLLVLFFNPVPYAGLFGVWCCQSAWIMIMANRSMEVGERFFEVGKKWRLGVVGVLILCRITATMSRSAWVAAMIRLRCG